MGALASVNLLCRINLPALHKSACAGAFLMGCEVVLVYLGEV